MPVFPFAKMTALCGLIALMVVFGVAFRASSAGEPSGPSAPVRLEIVNATETSRLACQLVLAHFVTQDLAPISAGDESVISLDRELDDGTLIYRHDGGRRMAVENILCGIAANWRATRADLNIAELRAGRRANLRIICQQPKALSCTIRGRAE